MEGRLRRAHGPSGSLVPTRSEVIATHGMAATSQPLASQVALDVLKRGGTAVDAAIAANATLGLMEPIGNGVGGDLFAIVWDAKTQEALRAQRQRPFAASLSLETLRAELEEAGFDDHPADAARCRCRCPAPSTAGSSCTRKFGKLPMKELLQPAIATRATGFPSPRSSPTAGRATRRDAREVPGLRRHLHARRPRAGQGRDLPQPAARRHAQPRSPTAAATRSTRARSPPRIDAYMRANGGYLRAADFAAHHSEWVEPVSTNYRGYDVWELPPNRQGIAALQMLNILEAYDLKSMGFGSADYLHLFIEAKKLAFEDRAQFYADPEFAKIPLEGLLSKAYAAKRRTLIRCRARPRSNIPPIPKRSSRATPST